MSSYVISQANVLNDFQGVIATFSFALITLIAFVVAIFESVQVWCFRPKTQGERKSPWMFVTSLFLWAVTLVLFLVSATAPDGGGRPFMPGVPVNPFNPNYNSTVIPDDAYKLQCASISLILIDALWILIIILATNRPWLICCGANLGQVPGASYIASDIYGYAQRNAHRFATRKARASDMGTTDQFAFTPFGERRGYNRDRSLGG